MIPALTLGAIVSWVLWPGQSDKEYDTPESAVMATCHAVAILGDYTPADATNIRIGWRRSGQPAGIGWSALVVRAGSRYRVQECKAQRVTHG